MDVKCAQCHIPAGKATRYRLTFALCVDCHKDEHAGQFVGEPWRNRCEQCHSGASFETSDYTLDKHQKSGFPLTGAHEAVACDNCHKAVGDSKVAVYHFKQLGCSTCHEDIHKGEFAKRMAGRDAAGNPLGCQVCHSTKEWKELSQFDHAQTKFPLLGTHRAVECTDCHKPPNLELTMKHVQFSEAPSACSECHENPHADQFGTLRNDCASCHDSNKWKPSRFDHEKTKFSLKGGHEGVACKACHTLNRTVDGKLVLFYKPTPTACADCHGANIPVKEVEHR
jgi:nitrate/TMAO reductase-like tetraheme cytochrome c subunit